MELFGSGTSTNIPKEKESSCSRKCTGIRQNVWAELQGLIEEQRSSDAEMVLVASGSATGAHRNMECITR